MINYFSSLCTANFGVVPCFSLWFLRFLPIFFSFNRLRHLVCIVFEAILFSLFKESVFTKNRTLFVTFSASIVKIFLFLNLLCSAKANAEVIPEEEIFLSKGEQSELTIKNLESYSIGNKEVIKHKYLKSKNLLILKGASLGFSDVIINTKQGKKALKIFVTSKRSQLKKMEAAGAIKKTGLLVNTYSDVIHVSGEIKDLRTYLLYHQLLKDEALQVVSEVAFGSDFAADFIDKLYRDFQQANYDFISCDLVGIDFHCSYSGNRGLKSLIEKYQKEYFVKMSALESIRALKLKLYIVYVKHSDSLHRDSGFNQISGSLSELLENGANSLRTGDLLLKNEDFESYLVASPSLSVLSGEKFEISMGEEQAIINQTPNSQTTTFKFSGIRFSGKLASLAQQYKVSYQMEITEGSQNNFSGPRGKSALLIDLDKTEEILDFELDQKSQQLQSIPWLSSIPVLGNLMQQSEDKFTHSILKFYLTLEEDL